MTLLTKEVEDRIQKIDLTEYVAAPGKLIRPCCICGQNKIAAAVKPGGKDEDKAICRGCIVECNKANLEAHRLNEPLVVGVDFCGICDRAQAVSTYQWGNKKLKVCSQCAGHWHQSMTTSPF
jgi:protein-arginine kinase activator protein McsA